MKTKLYKLTALFIIPALYYILMTGFKELTETNNIIVPPPGPSGNRDFVNCIFNGWPITSPPHWIPDNLTKYNDLKFNTIHTYDMITATEFGTDAYGTFAQDLRADQKTNITNLTNSITGARLDFWYERVKISKLCYAQRLIYEIKQPGTANVNNGFCYGTCSGEYLANDMGNTALHLDPEEDAPNTYIAKDIYENLQHGDLYNFNIQFNDKGLWHLKPRMRIPQSIFNNPNNRDLPVVNIDIVNYRGDIISSVVIRVWNFRDANNSYNGSYIDKFSFESGIDSLSIEGGDGKIHTPPLLNDGQNGEIEDWRNWEANCKTDFRVKWLGQCEVWFDKMTVDDVIANNLLSNEKISSFDEHILDVTTPENFLYVVNIVRGKKFRYENTEPINRVLNVMWSKLQNQALPISLKRP